MSFNARNRYDHSRRRRRRNIHSHPSSSHSPLTTLATTAVVAYGAYRLGSWAWNSYFGKEEDEGYTFGEGSGYDSESESEDDEYDDAVEPSRKDLRSRRSRADWSEYNHRHRSNPHSPHHDHQNGSKRNNGAAKNTNSAGVGEKIVTSTTAAIGAAVSAGISAGINAYNNNQTAAASARFIRNSRKDRCRLEASRAMMDFLPTLKKAIVKQTDITAEMEELKRIRVQKKEYGGEQGVGIREREGELWNSIKNKSITRLLTTIYAHTIVFLVLTVQVNLLGGRLLREEQQAFSQGQTSPSSSDGSDSDGSDRYRSSHKTVLAKTYHHVFAKGIPSLTEAVAKAADDVLHSFDVLRGDDVSLDDVSCWMEAVRDVMEKRQQKGNASALVQFIIPDDEVEQSSEESMDELARYILDETYDLLESPTYAHAERLCLDVTFAHLRDDGYAKLFSTQTISDREQEENNDEERIPVAKVITHLQKQTVATFYKPPSHQEEMKDWEGVFRMIEEPLPSSPNVYIPKFFDAVAELSDVCFN